MVGANSGQIEVDGFTANREYEMRVGVRKMDESPGEEGITAWSKSRVGKTVLATYKAQLILASTDWDNDFHNRYSEKYLDLQETLNANMNARDRK